MWFYVSEDSDFSIERPHKNENVNGTGSGLFLLYIVVFSTTYEYMYTCCGHKI